MLVAEVEQNHRSIAALRQKLTASTAGVWTFFPGLEVGGHTRQYASSANKGPPPPSSYLAGGKTEYFQ